MIKTRVGSARVWVTAMAVAVALAILLSLGTWQVVRLQWKTALIAELAARVAAQAVPFPDDGEAADDDLEFLRVRLAGTFQHDGEFHLVSRTRDGVAGVQLMTPLQVEAGRYVLVNRGWVIDPAAAGIARPDGVVVVEGVIRHFPTPGRFTPDNDPADNVWFYPERAAMTSMIAGAAGLAGVAPVYIGVIDPEGSPAGDPPGVNLRNNHLGYAITWYGLAVVLLGVVAAAMFKGRTSDGEQ